MHGYRRLLARPAAAALTVLGLLGSVATSAAGAPPAKSERPVLRITDLFGPGHPLPVGSSNLARTRSGLSARLRTAALTPRDVVTMWWVVFNDPTACEAGIPGLSRCGPRDAHAGRGGVSLMHAAGRVANEDGSARYGAHVRRGDRSRALAGPGVVRPREAEVILVLKTHGPRIPLLGSEQLRTFAGGCDDQSGATRRAGRAGRRAGAERLRRDPGQRPPAGRLAKTDVLDTRQEEQRMSTTSLDTYRGMNYELAESLACTWERRQADIERTSTPVRDWLVDELRPQTGDTLLELAAGTGETGYQAAEVIGAHGRLYSTDFSPAMLAAARRRGAELGVANVEYKVIDAERIELDDDSVDGVICRFGYMLMADPAAALAETRRVLRPGRRLTLAVWGAPERNPFFTAIVLGLVQRGHVPPPEPGGPGLFSMASSERTAQMLRDAGFADVRTEEVPVQFEVPDIDEYADFIADTAGTIAMAVRGVSGDERDAVKAQAGAALERFRDGGGYRIPGAVLCAVAS